MAMPSAAILTEDGFPVQVFFSKYLSGTANWIFGLTPETRMDTRSAMTFSFVSPFGFGPIFVCDFHGCAASTGATAWCSGLKGNLRLFCAYVLARRCAPFGNGTTWPFCAIAWLLRRE